MKKLKFWWKQFCFSVGAQINAVLLLMLILFLSFSIYNHSLFNQFNARYQKEINQYYSILELKNHFLQSGILFEEYMKTGNRTTLAEFNDTYEIARSVIDILYTESTNEESWYLLRGIDQSFESYYSECCNASFLYNGSDYRYYDSFYYSQTIGEYLEKYTNELLQYALESSVDSNRELTYRRKVMTAFNMGAVAAACVLIAASASYIFVRVTRPLNELKKQVEEILNEQKIFCGEIEVDMEKNLRVIIRFSEKITEKQKEAVQDGRERICGLGKDQYQILDPGDGVEGVGNSTSSGDTSAGGRASGNPEKQ